MQAIVETVFDTIYLVSVIAIGLIMVKRSGNDKQFKLFGLMALVLGFGDAFHLVPRAYALNSTGLEDYAVALGTGKFITSIIMTVFYILLYYIWRRRYNIKGRKGLDYCIYGLSLLRIAICLCPENDWFSLSSPLSWGIYRNIPFAFLGFLIIVLFYTETKGGKDPEFRWMWLTIVLSFGFYIPVVLWADAIPLIGMLMIPKTLAYVWTVLIGYGSMRKRSF